MGSTRGRSGSPKRLGNDVAASKPEPQDVPGDVKTSKASPRSRSPSNSRASSRPASAMHSRRSDSRSMSLSRSSSGSRSRSASRSSSRSHSPRRKRGRSYSQSATRSRSRSYSSYSSRSDSRDSTQERGRGSRAIEVTKLTKNVSSEHIREIFGFYGNVKEVDLPILRRIGSHRGTAIVTFDSEKSAQKAVSHMDRGQLDGSLISVRLYRAPSPPRGPAALRRGSNTQREPTDGGNRYGVRRGSNVSRRNGSPPRRSFGKSRSPPRRSFADSRSAGRPNRSRSPPYRRKRSVSRSLSRSPRRNARRSSPKYGRRNSRRNRSYSKSDSSSFTRSSISRSPSPRR